MIKFILSLFPKPLQTTITPIEKPKLKVFSSMVPESYTKEFKSWDGNLYPNKVIFKDTLI